MTEVKERTYIAIDLKSFYASVECVERGLDPLDTNLVVADASRTEKTICLAVSPSLKSHGIAGRARLFEVVQQVKEVNALRRSKYGKEMHKASYLKSELDADPSLEVTYIAAMPRMALYMEYSNRIYEVYLKYVAPEDMHVYSVDEVFLDVTDYLRTYRKTPHELALTMIRDVLHETGITATAGIGTNMYLCKVAMDIVAKHVDADEDGVRIAELDEMSYRRLLWDHKPITDFWRVGRGYAKKLAAHGLETMGDVARCSLGGPQDFYNEDLLYKLFGINAELLIDHAWGWEPTMIRDIKAYRPETKSISSGQVLTEPYDAAHARLIVKEMTDLLALDLVDKRVKTDLLVLTIGYDIENLTDPARAKAYHGEVTVDRYGRRVPKHAHGTKRLDGFTSSTVEIVKAMMELYDRIMDPNLLARRITVVADHITPEDQAQQKAEEQGAFVQMDLFTDYEALEQNKQEEEARREKERKVQEAMLAVKKKYGKNAMLKGMNLEEGGTTIARNAQIGGHKA